MVVSADEYETQRAPSDADPARVELRPNIVLGRVVDQAGEPIGNAWVASAEIATRTGSDGHFRLEGVPRDPVVRIMAAGHRTYALWPEEERWIEARLEPFVARGLYIGFGAVGLRQSREALVQRAEKLGLNAIILDVKSDRGLVNASVASPLSEEIGASVQQPEDLEAVVRSLKARGFYLIGRIVVFKDTPLAWARPELAVRAGSGLYRDCEEQLWVDPSSREGWDYNIDLALNAAKIGFDEVQFDYVRFPSDCIRGALGYSQAPTPQRQRAAIEGFLEAATQRLKPAGVFLAADVFGLTTIEEDIGIGQSIEGIAQHVDYVSPMVYPSTWRSGAFGAAYPPAEPYRIVHGSVKQAVERLRGTPAKVRPWLQAFNDYQQQKLAYTHTEIAAQITAAQDAGALGWMLWDPHGRYPLGGSLAQAR